MLIYNVTTKVDWSIAEEWVKWMQEVHIPDVMGSGCFQRHQLVKILDIDEQEGPTYAAQFYAATKTSYEDYINNFSATLREHVISKWGNKFISFRTLMELVDQ
jgi:hypothetical protein